MKKFDIQIALYFFKKGCILTTLVLIFFTASTLLFPFELDNHGDNLDVPAPPPLVIPEDKPEVDRKDLPLTWSNPDINKIKTKGCVADGILNEYNKPKYDIPLAHDSECYYFHRALETWREAPDFVQAREIMQNINRPDVKYGMFIAEAISTKEDYWYREENREFDFKEMCRKNSKNFWGEHTCKPSLKEKEYQAYLKQITRDAMDIGIQVFLFGQIHYQEENILFPKVDNVIREMRAYAKERGIEIIVGAQTGDITRKKYLQEFDFIEGGIGVHADGTIEDGKCFSKYWSKPGDWCWPLMWHKEYTERADHVFLYLDWNGQIGDDMHTFASMDADVRARTLKNLHAKFTAQNIGFFMPLITPLPKNAGNCHGPRKSFYSPHMDFGCKDIDTINDILK